VKVSIPTPLRSYTTGEAQVEAEGATLRQLLDDLDRRHPGLKFRVVDEQGRLRKHMRVFLNRSVATDLDQAVKAGDEVTLMQALSGG
jgi:molybdopterin synthase sulfur carrier subunit